MTPAGAAPGPIARAAHGRRRLPWRTRSPWRGTARPSWLLGAALFVLLAVAAASQAIAGRGGADPRAPTTLLELREAEASVDIDGARHTLRAALPYHWDRRHPGSAGSARFVIDFALDEVPEVPWAAFIGRVGNAYEIRLNDLLLSRAGELDVPDDADFAKVPKLMTIPVGLLRQANRLELLIRADVGRRAGLAPIVLGPETTVRSVHDSASRFRVRGSMVVVAVSLLAGVIALMLWLTQVDGDARGRPRRDALYLYAWGAELCFALRMSDALIERPPLSWPAWNAVTTGALGGWVGCLTLFCMVLVDQDRVRSSAWRRALPALAIASGAAAGFASVAWARPMVLTAWQGVLAVACIVFCIAYLVRTVRNPAPMQRLVAAALVLNVAVGLRDWAVFRLSDAYGHDTLLRYTALAFGLSLGYIAIQRFRTATSQARELLANLSDRVAERESALAESHRQYDVLSREQARVGERERILRDMHDGVGSSLSAAIRQLQGGQVGSDAVVATLRDALDRLKLSIDAMSVPPGDVVALLANLRHRLEPRLVGAGLALEWEVSEMAPVARFDAEAMRVLQSLVLEAVSNVLQHAGANTLRIEAEEVATGPRVRIIDDGRGFDASTRGPRAIAARAGTLHARLAVDGTPGRTTVEIVLPRAVP
ncbi:MAG: histidine kinase [Burkholderiales bacterium]|nr:MAG: histidine kinase [Burkholderiales bacterium]